MLSNPSEENDTLDPRVKRTRQLLSSAFMDLVKEKGFQAVSVQDITFRAGINRATFYAHFSDKYALLDYFIRQEFRQEIKKRMLNACRFSRENLRALIIAVCEFIVTAHGYCVPAQNKFETSIEAEIKGQVHDLILKWLEQLGGVPASDLAATSASWSIYGLASQWSHTKDQGSAETFADHVLPLVESNLNLKSTVNPAA